MKCGDCDRLYEDFACYGYTEEDSAMTNGKLCRGFIDKKEGELRQILSFWKVHNLYDRGKINKLIDEFEEEYLKLTDQGGTEDQD